MEVETRIDAERVRRVRAGDQDVYGELVERHHPRVLGLCVSMLRDEASAEDAAQDVFVKAYQSLEKFQGESSFGTWIYRIASNHCLDLVRSRARRNTESLDALLENGDGELRGSAAASGRELDSAEDADLAGRLLSRLPEQYRMPLILREVEGLSCAELAQTFDCSLTAMKARLRRARSSLDQIARGYHAAMAK